MDFQTKFQNKREELAYKLRELDRILQPTKTSHENFFMEKFKGYRAKLEDSTFGTAEETATIYYLYFIENVIEKEKHNNIYINEFQMLPNPDNDRIWEGRKRQNENKNRYPNILPYDDRRVKLRPNENNPSGYINASYITYSAEFMHFIATIDPMKNTAEDFWEMVLQFGSYIVMLTDRNDKSKNIFPYFPRDRAGDYVVFGQICVTFQKSIPHPACPRMRERIFLLKKGNKVEEIKHYCYDDWPENDPPHDIGSFRYFVRECLKTYYNWNYPIVMHCNDGVGRTGTLITLFTLFSLFKIVKVYDIGPRLDHIRNQRMLMIKNIEQYVFIHHVITEMLAKVDLPCTTKDYYEFEFSMRKSTMVKFEFLKALCKKSNKGLYQVSTLQEKREFLEKLKLFPVRSTNNYLEAVSISDMNSTESYIATKLPTKEEWETFWYMVIENGFGCVITLDQLSPSEQYWPTKNKTMTFNNLIIIAKQCLQSTDTWEIQSLILEDKEKRKKMEVFHINFFGWKTSQQLPNKFAIKDLIDEIKSLQDSVQRSLDRIVFQCYDGETRSGLFACIFNIYEYMHETDIINVYQTAKMTLRANPAFIKNAQQYAFLYEVTSLMVEDKLQIPHQEYIIE